MRCDKIKGLIIDYIDGEVNQALHKDIASHLDVCPSCKKIEQSLRRAVIEPLRKAKKVEAPDRIWYRLRDVLTGKKQRHYLPHLIAEWIDYFRIRKPILVPATTMIAVVLLIVVFLFGKTFTTQNMLNAYIEEQVQFFWQLTENGEGSYFGIDDINLDTCIEKYLL